jgi:dienelactone hydrolase
MSINDYEEFPQPFTTEGMTHRVFFRGRGPGVILMHEILGMSPECVALGDRLVDAGFTVFLPLLFGEPEQSPRTKISEAHTFVRVCISREFHCFESNQSSPVTVWLRALSREVRDRGGGRRIGAIGMCLTGGFVLTMMIDEWMMAPVSCQPSLPLNPPGPDDGSWRDALGITPHELDAAKARHAAGVPLLGVRYETDDICPRQRMDRLQRDFPNMIRIDLPATEARHATLTEDFNAEAFAAVVAFLRRQLQES